MTQEFYYAIGLMSGTSMDGVDAALILTDGYHKIDFIDGCFIAYDPTFQTQLKAAERFIAQQKGHYKLTQMPVGLNITLSEIVNLSAQYHAQAIKLLLQQVEKKQITLDTSIPTIIGYHGQTFYHKPSDGQSVILGNPSILAQAFSLPVIYDFRTNDMVHGGMGAPLAPIYHYALCMKENLHAAVVINCGGISNATYIPNQEINSITAFDIGPGNTLIDQFVKNKTNGSYSMDLNGRFANQGTCRTDLFDTLREKTCLQYNFYNQNGPKALDIHDLYLPDFIKNLSLADGCATLAGFTGDLISQTIKNLTFNHVILSGGGWKNPAILRALKFTLYQIHPHAKINLADAYHMRSQSMEAELMAYLAVRFKKQLPISFPCTTGVKIPISGGKEFINE